jgi:hypothetical protein
LRVVRRETLAKRRASVLAFQGVSRKPTALAVPTARYTRIDPTPHRDRRRTGQPTPDGWEQVYLKQMATHGAGWRAAKQAGVSYSTVQRLRAADPRFAEDEHDAVWEHVATLEGNLDRIAAGDDMPAVTSNIVRLKRLDPGYIERTMNLSLSATTELEGQDGKALLQAMLRAATPATVQALAAAPSETP